MDALSPSKDSRGLIDASEKPLTLSIGDDHHHWPALTPRSASISLISASMPPSSQHSLDVISSATLGLHASSTVAAERELTNVIVGKPSASTMDSGEIADVETSSNSSFVSADDASPKRKSRASSCDLNEKVPNLHGCAIADLPEGHNKEEHAECKIAQAQQNFPARQASLRNRISSGSLVASTLAPAGQNTGFTDFTCPGSLSIMDSRPHSPSPASFSRPRPASLSHHRHVPSPSPSTRTARPATAARAQKTASRIPIPDSKKATLVDIKTRGSSGIPTPEFEASTSFGSRWLDAPDALKILDQGMKRRQLQRTNTNSSGVNGDPSGFADILSSQDTLVAKASISSSPDLTDGPSSSEDHEVATPVGYHALPCTNSYYRTTALKLFDNAITALGKTPPSTSPFTDPLQTIPSQAMLPTFDAECPGEYNELATQSVTPSGLAKQVAHLATALQTHAKSHGTLPESAPSSLLDLLSAYEREDNRFSGGGVEMLNQESRKHLTRTLSLLEGGGGSLQTDVDSETLLRMFGHLKCGLEAPSKTTSFVDNVAAAERYLAQADKPSNAGRVVYSTAKEDSSSPSHGNNETMAATCHDIDQMEGIASKWSNSTSSDKYVDREVTKTVGPKDTPRSIGYPSYVASKATVLVGPSDSGPVTRENGSRGQPFPTMGKRDTGSVRAARETLRHVEGGFQRTTASAESKKSEKFPTPNTKAYDPLGTGQRGRVPSAEKPRHKSDMPTLSKVIS